MSQIVAESVILTDFLKILFMKMDKKNVLGYATLWFLKLIELLWEGKLNAEGNPAK